jgi:hypothetical protein
MDDLDVDWVEANHISRPQKKEGLVCLELTKYLSNNKNDQGEQKNRTLASSCLPGGEYTIKLVHISD